MFNEKCIKKLKLKLEEKVIKDDIRDNVNE